MSQGGGLILAVVLAPLLAAQQRLIELADPLVGTLNGGNTTPGAQVPFGLISIGPDTASAAFNGMTNGYNPNADVIGFSATHESGTGGDAKYGNFRVTPTVGEASPRNLIYPWGGEQASPGFYGVTMGRPGQQIRVELTATRLVAVERYSFPSGVKRNLLLDVSSRILMPAGQDSVSSFPQRATGGQVTVTDARHVEGTIHMAGGWNPAPYTLYFAAELSAPANVTGTWDQDRVYVGRNHAAGVDQTTRTLAGYRNQMGAVFQFPPAPTGSPAIELRLAVSFVSMAKARTNLHAEGGSSFAETRRNAEEAWESVLGKIEVQGGTEEQRREFYTALYRSHIMPHDLTGENVWWKSDVPHYEDFYTLWDTFRTLHPLFTLIEPERQAAMVQSLLDTYQHTGWLPDARIAGANGLTQGGSNGDVLIADALVKHLPGINRTLAYAAVLKDAEVEATSTPAERAHGTDQAWYQGRQLIDWKRVGYMSLSYQRSATRTLEYAADDYSVATVAHLMGETAVSHQLLKSSGNWRHLWDAKLRCIHPRYADGEFLENFECDHLYPDNLTLWWDAPLYEGSSTQYSTYVPHDLPGLVQLLGGNAAATSWLDRIFDQKLYTQGNEPDLLAPFTYVYTGRQDRTAERVRAILASEYHTGRAGLPGNDDAGTMSSWLVWSCVGIYPLAGQPLYLIGSPVFTQARVQVGQGRSLVISAPASSVVNLYVQSAELNGQPFHRAWLTHSELTAGGTLFLHMGAAPMPWDTEPPPGGVDAWNLVPR